MGSVVDKRFLFSELQVEAAAEQIIAACRREKDIERTTKTLCEIRRIRRHTEEARARTDALLNRMDSPESLRPSDTEPAA